VVAAASLAAAITAPSQAVAVPAAVAVPPNAAAVANPAANRIVTARIKATRVFVVGDSLTVGADPYIRQALGTSVRRVAINAQVGRFTSEGISLLSPQSPSRVWVVALGTNDGPDAAATRAWVARVMALAGKRQVIIMTIVRPGGYHVVNQAMIDMRRRYRNHIRRLGNPDRAQPFISRARRRPPDHQRLPIARKSNRSSGAKFGRPPLTTSIGTRQFDRTQQASRVG
jgi:hypothetical protein